MLVQLLLGQLRECPWDKPGLSLGQNPFAPGTKPAVLLILHNGRLVCPKDKLGLSLGQSWGRRAAEKVYVVPQGKTHINITNLQDCPRTGWVLKFCLCVFLFGSFLMGEKNTNKVPPSQIPGQSRENFVYVFFGRSQLPCPIRLDDRGTGQWK